MVKTTILVYVASFFYIFGLSAQDNRPIDGFNNNLAQPSWGATGAEIVRTSEVNYSDGAQEINDANLPIPRLVSNALFGQQQDILEPSELSDYIWLFGQFLDHDISYVSSNGNETKVMELTSDEAANDFTVFLTRNDFIAGTGTSPGNPRQYENKVTSFIDASTIYGSTQEKSDWLRSFEGGKLKVSNESLAGQELLPWNTTTGEFNGSIDYSESATMIDESRELNKYFVTGDVRANENLLLLCIHTLFLREHNRLAGELALQNPSWDDEALFQRARKLLCAYIQNITYYEWLPAMGVTIPKYRGYDPSTNPVVLNEFSAAAFSLYHTMIDADISRIDNNGDVIEEGNLTFGEGLYNPTELLRGGGLDAYLKGMGTQVMQEMDCKMIDDLRNLVLQEDTNRGLDLAAINIYRNRDRGLTDYNTMRTNYGLPPMSDFEDLSDSPVDNETLSQIYGDINNVDAWVGMLAERHFNDVALFGDLVMTILKEQFIILRDGDRFYFENDDSFSQEEIELIKSTKLHDIITRNTGITLMQPDVFSATAHQEIPNIVVEERPLEAIIFPNPADETTIAKIYSDIDTEMTYILVNHIGQKIQQGSISLTTGSENFLDLPFSNSYDSGIYNLILTTETRSQSYSILKVK